MWLSTFWFAWAVVVVWDFPAAAVWLLVIGLIHVHYEQIYGGRRIRTMEWLKSRLQHLSRRCQLH